jgi:hypothetical protein
LCLTWFFALAFEFGTATVFIECFTGVNFVAISAFGGWISCWIRFGTFSRSSKAYTSGLYGDTSPFLTTVSLSKKVEFFIFFADWLHFLFTAVSFVDTRYFFIFITNTVDTFVVVLKEFITNWISLTVVFAFLRLTFTSVFCWATTFIVSCCKSTAFVAVFFWNSWAFWVTDTFVLKCSVI